MPSTKQQNDLAEILLVEDSLADIMMTREALTHQSVFNPLHVAEDGTKAMAYLRRENEFEQARRPGLVILDLNLPGKSGREVLSEIKSDPDLMQIPVVILTTSRAEDDVAGSYCLNANCYIVKPVDFASFKEVVRTINDFWLGVVTLPFVED